MKNRPTPYADKTIEQLHALRTQAMALQRRANREYAAINKAIKEKNREAVRRPVPPAA